MHYRDYLDPNGELIADRKEHFDAFVWFVEKMLKSVNAQINDFGLQVMKRTPLRRVFTVSDEAFALVLLENYYQRWVKIAEDEEGDTTRYRTDPSFAARWTSSENGRKGAGWHQPGIDRFSELAKMIGEACADTRKGELLDDYLMKHWRKVKVTKRATSDTATAPVAAPYMETGGLFVGELASI